MTSMSAAAISAGSAKNAPGVARTAVVLALVLLSGAAAPQTPAPAAAGTAAALPPPQPQTDPATAFLGTVFQGSGQMIEGSGHMIQHTGQELMQQSNRFMQQGVATMGAGFGQMVGTGDAAEAARTAATSLTKLPMSGITAGHERCAIAPNGAPDCLVAATALCRAKGYGGGTSVDFITVENCPPQYRTARRDEIPAGVCASEHYVTHALCQ